MAEPFRGVINVDIRDSEPDWTPFEPARAPAGAPNVVYIVLDDVGFSAMACYGGPIETPNIDRIANAGVRYTQWHTTALCSPTRSCLLTGRNHTRNSMACISEAAIGFPNGSGTIPPENGMLSEILAERGWNTYMVGKWHLCPTDEMNLASTRRNWPSGRGFERWYGFLGAETNQWYPDLVYDNHPVDQPRSPEEGYHLTDDLTDRALEFIADAKAVVPEKPFFLYYAPGACHAPHHAPKEWIERFKGRFDMGYEAIRETTLARQKELGIVPGDTELPPVNPIGTPENRRGPNDLPYPELDYTRPWDSLNGDEKRLFAHMAEVYAGFLGHADYNIGRLLDYLEKIEELDNTVVVLVSDNGASGEGGPNGSVNEMKFANGIPDDLAENLAKIDDLGGPLTYNHYPTGWAMAFNTPFKMWKRYEYNGGTADPCIISWPGSTKARGQIRDQYHHAVDVVPTLLDLLDVEAPATIKGHVQSPLDGLSMRAGIDDASSASPRKTQFYAMLGSRAIWHEGWKAVTTHPVIAGWGHFNDDEWELYHTDVDRNENHNLAEEHPDKLRELVNLWFAEAGANERVPPRRPLGSGDPQHPAASALRATRPLRLPARHRTGPRVAGGQHARPVLCDRGAGRHPRTWSAGSDLRVRDTLRRPRALREGQPPGVREQLRRDRRAEDRRFRGRADRHQPDPGRLVREGRHRGRPHQRDPVAVPERPAGGPGQDQDPAWRVRDRGCPALCGPPQWRACHRRLSGRAAVPVHRGHH